MARKELTKSTIRTLFSRTGNQCAFPGCSHPLVDEDSTFVAEVCHIEAASPKGPRYNSAMTDDERRAPENLLILCHRHHVKVDRSQHYTVDVLKRMKAAHEVQWAERRYDVPEEAVEEVRDEELRYWQEVAALNQTWLSEFDLASPLRVSANPLDYVSEACREVEWLGELLNKISAYLSQLHLEIPKFLHQIGIEPGQFEAVAYYKNPFHLPFWELLNIGVPNHKNAADTNLLLLEIYLLFQKARLEPENIVLRAQLEEKKAVLIERASSLGIVD